MAAIFVSWISCFWTAADVLHRNGNLKQLADDLIFPFCVSLGPTDGLFAQVSATADNQVSVLL